MKVMIFGTFDDLHPGHLYVFRNALERGEVWVVVARDANVLKIKGRPPLQSQEARIAAIQKAFPSAHVLLGAAKNFLTPVRNVKPDLILLGYDQHLPPGVTEEKLGVPVERLDAFDPHIHKSSLRRSQENTSLESRENDHTRNS
jgi:FAD synthetase